MDRPTDWRCLQCEEEWCRQLSLRVELKIPKFGLLVSTSGLVSFFVTQHLIFDKNQLLMNEILSSSLENENASALFIFPKNMWIKQCSFTVTPSKYDECR